MKIAHLAELHQVRTGCHGATDLSPVCMAAALHFGLSVHNFGIQEHMPHNEETDRVSSRMPTRSSAASCIPAMRPGSAWTSTRRSPHEHPYVRAYLPVNRRLDGTVHDW